MNAAQDLLATVQDQMYRTVFACGRYAIITHGSTRAHCQGLRRWEGDDVAAGTAAWAALDH